MMIRMMMYLLNYFLQREIDMKKNLNSNKQQGTFIVKVEHCQNNSWQGKVTWADENKTQRFRSMLELIKLMDEAVNQNQNMDEMGADHFVS